MNRATAKLVHFLRRLWLDGRLYIANNIVAYIPIFFIRRSFYKSILKIQIDKGANIFMRAWFDCPGNLSIGKNTIVNQKCRLDGRGGLTIGDNVSISAEVCILTASHDMQSSDGDGITSPVIIEDYVFIGTRALILPGASLGKGCVVGAGSVVTRPVAPNTIVAGAPAKQIGMRTQNLRYSSRYRRLFH
jgi:maltose O-acetyltransferase